MNHEREYRADAPPRRPPALDGAGRDAPPGRPLPEDGRLGEPSLPNRKWLGHGVPPWVNHGIFFITINALHRGSDVLIQDKTQEIISAAALHYHGLRWWIHLWLVMPDHIHALLSFPQEAPMINVVADWKRFGARSVGVEWQKGFFDHRLRKEESFEEKSLYIRMNPVRQKLVEKPETWPHVLAFDSRTGMPYRLEDGRLGEPSLPPAGYRP